MTAVSVSGLGKAFGTRVVLEGLDLDVHEGSITAVLGPSGSGKTTLLRVLAGFERADSGSVSLAGTVVEDATTHVPPERRRIGYVPQDGALFPHLSVSGNVGFGLTRHQRQGKRIEDLLSLVGLSGEGMRYPHQLSGGQQQRVALARALAMEPRLVLLDEPFSSLDASLRLGLRADVQRVLRKAGATAVLVTHDQDEALSIADQVAVLRGGRVAQHGSPEELYDRPSDPAMARFVGDANVLEGVVHGDAVNTHLGLLRLALEPSSFRESQEVLVLVRPEQVEVLGESGSEGLPGRVAESHYHGHDTVTTVDIERDGKSTRLFARLPGGSPLPPGANVRLRANGSVFAWALDDPVAARMSEARAVSEDRT